MEVKAKVIRGRGRGRRIGFPTINFQPKEFKIKHGVYLINFYFKRKKYFGLIHFGPKKTFNEEISAEAHLRDFNLDIYGRIVKIEVLERIRGVRRFKNKDELIAQIKKDIKKVQKYA